MTVLRAIWTLGRNAQSTDLPSGLYLVKMAISDLQGVRGSRGQEGVSSTRSDTNHVDDQDDCLGGILVQQAR